MTQVITDPLGMIKYPRVYYHQGEPNRHQQQEGLRPVERYGFPTTAQTRLLLIDGLAGLLDTFNLESPSQSFWEEARTFIIDDQGTARGATGATDDEVIALAGAALMSQQPGAKTLRQTPRLTPAATTYSWGYK